MSLEQRQKLVELIGQARAEGARLNAACDKAGIDPATYRRWHNNGVVVADRRRSAMRPVPLSKLSVQERELILLTCHLPQFQSQPPSQIVPTLADLGMYMASESSFYRILREANQQHDRGKAKSRNKRAKPEEYEATSANQIWCWDVTWIRSAVNGMYYYLYMIMDVFSRKITAWEIYETESGELASELLRRGVFAEGCAATLQVLHADNGAIQRSSTLKATMEWLGIDPSYSRPRVSNDNAYPESLFKTAKYRPSYPVDGFDTIEKAREWCKEFVHWYNEEHKHSGIKFVTPSQRHSGKDVQILAQRHELYIKARPENLSRRSGETRNWQRPETVILNPDKPTEKLEKAA